MSRELSSTEDLENFTDEELAQMAAEWEEVNEAVLDAPYGS